MIRIAQKKDIKVLADIRYHYINDTYSHFGKKFLRYFYFPLFIFSKEGVVLVYAENGSQVLGYVNGSYNFFKLKHKSYRYIVWRLMITIFMEPLIIVKAISRVLKQNNQQVKTDDKYQYEGKLNSMAVLPSSRKKGVGSKLVKALIDDFKSHHLKNIVLNCKSDNYKALNLYKKYGFKKIDQSTENNINYDILLLEL